MLRVVALVLVTLVVAWGVHSYDAIALRRIDSMSSGDYVAYARHIHEHGYLFHFTVFLIFGGFYLGLVEFIVYSLRFCTRKHKSVE
jgi:hypothetical protein